MDVTEFFEGFFINLDRAQDRKKFMEAQLANFGLDSAVKRFGALMGDDRSSSITKSELGCFLSHEKIISSASGLKTLLVLEDDAVLSSAIRRIFPSILAACSQYDIIFLNAGVNFYDVNMIKSLLQLKSQLGDCVALDFSNFRMLDGSWYRHGTSAYLVSSEGCDKLRIAFSEMIAQNFPDPIDIFYLKLIQRGRIKAGVVFPFLSAINYRFDTQMADREGSYLSMAQSSISNIFMANSNLAALQSMVSEEVQGGFSQEAYIASRLLYRYLNPR